MWKIAGPLNSNKRKELLDSYSQNKNARKCQREAEDVNKKTLMRQLMYSWYQKVQIKNIMLTRQRYKKRLLEQAMSLACQSLKLQMDDLTDLRNIIVCFGILMPSSV